MARVHREKHGLLSGDVQLNIHRKLKDKFSCFYTNLLKGMKMDCSCETGMATAV
jgi:hypothetical protein